MSGFDFDDSDLLRHLNLKERNVLNTQHSAMQKVTDDLGRIASEIAPIKGSVLRKSLDKSVEVKPDGVVGEVAFSATETSEKGRFNYALWTHEMDYTLGDKSSSAPGTNGYEVGNKYLERPLKGEAEKYINWWANATAKELD